MAADVELEAAVAGADAGLFGHAGVVAVHLLLADADAAREADPDRDAGAGRLLLALVLAGVLQTFDAQVAAGLHDQRVAGSDVAVAPVDVIAVGLATQGQVAPGAQLATDGGQRGTSAQARIAQQAAEVGIQANARFVQSAYT